MTTRPTGADPRDDTPPPQEWEDLSALIRHIVGTHHRYVRDSIPAITSELRHLVDAHDDGHPEIAQVFDTFTALAGELLTHLSKEEHLLFPYIDELTAARLQGTGAPRSPFGTIANPLRMMEDEHESALRLMQRLRDLTRDYASPADGTPDYLHCLSALGAFDADLSRHIDLENSRLFPRALDLEEEMK